MTDGTKVGPRPPSPIPADLLSSMVKALEAYPTIEKAVADLPDLPTRIFLVGAGGSYVGLVPLQYLLDSESRIPTVRMNSDEFYYRKPPTVTPGTLVVALSGAGKTRETVRATEWAVKQGGESFGITLKPDSALAHAASTTLSLEDEPGGFRSQLGGLAASQMMQHSLGLLLLARDGSDIQDRRAALEMLPELLVTSLEDFEPQAAELARSINSQPMTYLIASGSLLGAASTFTMCFMQEMQWMHASTINANEFFQGPFEIIDSESAPIVFLGEDRTQPMGERVRRFLDTYAGRPHYVDSETFVLPGLSKQQRAFVLPIIYHSLTTRIAAHLSAISGYELDGRRYMWKVEY